VPCRPGAAAATPGQRTAASRKIRVAFIMLIP
jgi:hypothetical protein